MHHTNATKTIACVRLYFHSQRDFWIASDVASAIIYGRFNGEYFS